MKRLELGGFGAGEMVLPRRDRPSSSDWPSCVWSGATGKHAFTTGPTVAGAVVFAGWARRGQPRYVRPDGAFFRVADGVRTAFVDFGSGGSDAFVYVTSVMGPEPTVVIRMTPDPFGANPPR